MLYCLCKLSFYLFKDHNYNITKTDLPFRSETKNNEVVFGLRHLIIFIA